MLPISTKLKSKFAKYLACRFPNFSAEGTLAGSRVTPVHTGYCLCFRHDMDSISTAELLQAFLEQDAANAQPSTLFVLEEDFPTCAERVADMLGRGYELQLHSEAKPAIVYSNRWLPAEGWLTWRYAANLRRQQSKLERSLGTMAVRGHCPHAGNNYLYFANYLNWNLIERASTDAGYDYLSDWRLPARTPEGEPFPAPLPPHWHHNPENDSCLILPTQWDDKFFFLNYEACHLGGRNPHQHTDSLLDEAFDSVLAQATICERNGWPLIINLHPIHMLNPDRPVATLKTRLCEWAMATGVPIRTLGTLAGLARTQLHD